MNVIKILLCLGININVYIGYLSEVEHFRSLLDVDIK